MKLTNNNNLPWPAKLKISNTEYHAHEAVGSSNLKKILRSPAHYLEEKLNPKPQTPDMLLGSATHDRILEKEIYLRTYAVAPTFSGTGSKAAREEWYLTKGAGKTILNEDQAEAVEEITKAVYSNKLCQKLLSGGHAEEAYFWIDPDTGVLCKCKPDYLREGHIIVDVKTTRDASFGPFQRDCSKLKYHLSAAMYLDGVSAVTGEKYDTFVIIAVEKKPPYAIAVYVFDEAALDVGRYEYKKALQIFKQCKAENHWRGYESESQIMPLSIPSYAFPEYDDE